MGDVYLAWTGLRLVAVKILHPHYASDATFVAMFLAEARVAGKINHSSIAQVLDVGVDAGRLYMVMEYVAGHTLDDLIADASLPLPTLFPLRLCASVFAAVAQALGAAHRAQVIHRDISPHNILVSDTGALKLIDFGIARTQNSDAMTSPGTFRGRFGYMAPEYVQGHDCDHRVDLFALGVVMWETFTRRRLYGGAAAAQLYAVIERAADRLDDVIPGFPTPLADVVGRLLDRDPDQRYQHATQVAHDLEALLPTLPDGGVRDLAHWVQGNLAQRIDARARADHDDLQSVLDRESALISSFEPVIEVTGGGSSDAGAVGARSAQADRSVGWALLAGLGGLALGAAALVIWLLGRQPTTIVMPAPMVAPVAAAASAESLRAAEELPRAVEPQPLVPEAQPAAPEVEETLEPQPAPAEPEAEQDSGDDAHRAATSQPTKRNRATKKEPSRRVERAPAPSPVKQMEVVKPVVEEPTPVEPPRQVPITIPSIAPPPPPPAPAVAAARTPRVPSSMVGDESRGSSVVGRCNACHTESKKRRVDGKAMTRSQWDRFFRNGTHDRYLSLAGKLSVPELAAAKAYLSARALDAAQDQSAGAR